MNRSKAIAAMKAVFEQENSQNEIIPGRDFIPHAAKVIDSNEISYLSESVLDAWFTTGKFAEKFELELLNPGVHHIGGIAYRSSEPIRIYVKNK